MKNLLAATICAAALAAFTLPSPTAAAEAHVKVAPDEVQWAAGPAVLPPGAQAAVLFGDPSKDGQFALRIKLPEGYHIPPHTHPAIENVTVISGTFRLGMGDTADPGKAEALSAGGFVSMPPGMAHYVYTDEETVVQVNSVGPWGLTYVNPADDPRKTQ